MPGYESRTVTRRERLVLMVGGTVWIALTGVLDYVTGVEIRLLPLYLLPICLVGWRLGYKSTLTAAWLSALAWFGANYAGGVVYSSATIWVANTISQGIAFSIVGALMVFARRSYWLADERARTDSLTSLLNGRAFAEDAARLMALCERHKRPVTVAYLDLDDFKRVNDRFGHARGDQVLAIVARVLFAAARDTDLVARIGGDEFALLLAETDETGAGVVLDRVRTSMTAAFENEPGGVTVSVGAIVSTGRHPTVDTLLKEADALLYKAKGSGKNRFVAATRGEPQRT